MRHLDTEALATFIAVVDFGSFTAAAAHIGKSQAAVSISVSRLEDKFGQKLIDRRTRTLTLTQPGERLLAHARKIQLLEAEAIADMLGPAQGSRVRLGMPDDYISLLGPSLIDGFNAKFPHTYIDLYCEFSRALESMIDDRTLDIALVTQNPVAPRGVFLREERQYWCTVHDAHPEQLDYLPLAMFSEGLPGHPGPISTLQKTGRPFKLVYSSSHLTGIQMAVASGRLLTILPEPAIPSTWRRLGVEHGLPELPPLRLALLMGKQPRLAVSQLAGFLTDRFSQI